MISVIFVTGSPVHRKANIASLEATNPEVEYIAVDAYDVVHKSVGWNAGAKTASGETLLFVDDDIIWTDEIVIPDKELFGPSPLHPHHIGYEPYGKVRLIHPWLDGWCIGVSRRLYDEVGGFDEKFKFSGMLDADFCVSCSKVGVIPYKWKFPGRHLSAHTKYTLNPDHDKTRIENIKYLVAKWNLEVA